MFCVFVKIVVLIKTVSLLFRVPCRIVRRRFSSPHAIFHFYFIFVIVIKSFLQWTFLLKLIVDVIYINIRSYKKD